MKPLIILAGPTASGKTRMSVKLAKKINGAIVSADSMQVYKYMDIGSAKVTKEEMEGIPHALVDVLEPSEEFHVVKFKEMAKEALDTIYASGKIPIVAGGTGFYIQALLYDVDFTAQEGDLRFRHEMMEFARQNGARALHEKLREVDPASYEAIHENNIKRVIRALEYYHLTKSPLSLHNETERGKPSPYNFAYFVLTDERGNLYQRIDKRVDTMMEQGLLQEVRGLYDRGYHRGMVSMQGLGYKEILDYLEGKCTLEEAVYIIKRETRHFAKRQLTWFKRERDVIWLDQFAYDYDDCAVLEEILKILKEKGILT